MPTLITILTVAAFVASFLLLRWEKKSKKWYTDRACIFTAGLFAGLGLVGLAAIIYLITA